MNSQVHIVNIKHKLFSPKSLTIEKGDTIEFIIDSSDSISNNYVLCVDDVEESNLLKRGQKFKTTFQRCGYYTIKCSINYKMKADIEVIIPVPKIKEWESPVIPHFHPQQIQKQVPEAVKRVVQRSITSIDVVREQSLTQKLNQVLKTEEHLEMKSLSRQEMEATFNNYSPVMINAFKEELKKEEPKTEEEKKVEELEEHKFIEQQRNSSLSSRAKSRSNKHTPESDRAKDTPTYNINSKCFNKLDFDKFEKDDFTQNKISEEESADDTQYSQSVESKTTYRAINQQSPF